MLLLNLIEKEIFKKLNKIKKKTSPKKTCAATTPDLSHYVHQKLVENENGGEKSKIKCKINN